MEKIRRLILENKAWAQGHNQADPDYFKNMSLDQNPEILWIGCADSRVPPDEIFNSRPGTLFVHRNIANIIYANDENILSVLEYAVGFLKVKYIIVCGHHNCGGVRAAFDGIENPRLNQWVSMITEIKKKNNPKDFNELVELNILKQLENLKNIDVIKKSWETSEYPKLVGWVYDLKTGLIKEIGQYENKK
jgi:carbonic anhydrase